MKRKRFTEEQIIYILKEHAVDSTVVDLVRHHALGREHDLPLEVEVGRHGSFRCQATTST